MAKSISILTSHEYTSRAGTMTVGEALAWVEKHATTEDEDTGEVSTYAPGDLIVYAVRRMMALAKDNKRVAHKVAPSRIYTPRVDVTGATKNAGQVKSAARVALANALHIPLATVQDDKRARKAARKAAAKVETSKRAAKVAPAKSAKDKIAANEARMAEIQAALAAKGKAPAKVAAKGPTVRKAAHHKPDPTGLRPVSHEVQGVASEPETVSDALAILMAAQ